MKDILPKNSKGRCHGYCEMYDSYGKLSSRGVAKNGLISGYHERHDTCFFRGSKRSQFFIK